MSVGSPLRAEATERFQCFGGTCTVLVQGSGPAGSAPLAAERAKRRLLEWHAQFCRFDHWSELSLLNRDPRGCVPVSAMMARFVEAAVEAATITGGLVDPTLLSEIEQAGYAHDFDQAGYAHALAHAAPPSGGSVRQGSGPRPAAPDRARRWRQLVVDRRGGTVTRPPGVQLDSGGIAKGLFGDLLASLLSWHESFAIEAAGDIRFGGTGGVIRPVHVTAPLGPNSILHTFELACGAAATSGTTKRSWVDASGQLAHHLLDPATGRPAFTGVVQATALAPVGVEAEALAKGALLAGAERAASWLRHGGVVIFDDGSYEVVEPGASEALR